MSVTRTSQATDPSQNHRDQGREVVRVRLLGGFSVSVGPRTIRQDEWRLRKAASLVKLLALALGHRLHREQAMDLLWPGTAARAAFNSLRQTLHAARKTLDQRAGSRYLATENEHLILCAQGQLWVDVEAFEEAAKAARCARDPAVYRAALDLYGGDLLPEDRYEEWAETRRGELRRLYLALLVELAGLHEVRGERALAFEALKKATAEEPALEEAHASIMRLHALSGRPERALAQYEDLREALSRALGTEPGRATRRLRDEIVAGRPITTPSTSPVYGEPSGAITHNLPAARTRFIGREREMIEAKRALAMTRLLTLTGAGGTGKTRLALELARDLVNAYSGGVRMVELASLSELDLVAQVVAEALGVRERPGQPLGSTLIDALGDKELLLVIDNCEHLVDDAARLVDALLDSCPRLRVLATSREPLGIGGELVWPVPPLSLPGADDEATVEGLMRYEAVRFFVERAHLRLPDFELTEENAAATASVCRKLDGIPLAIELATARMGTLAVEQVAQRMEASLDVLRDTSRTASPRQRTLRATLDWSYDLLSETERSLFRRLSVFAGRCTLEAVEAVCSGCGVEQGDVLDLLEGLVDKSLVVAGAPTGGAVRYRMLEPVRQYAQEKLKMREEMEGVRDRHAAFFLALAEECQQGVTGPEQRLWVERLEEEHDNLREALSWFVEGGGPEAGLRFCGALWRFWHARGYLGEGVGWLERALAAGETAASPVRVKALEGMGWLVQRLGDTERAEAAYAEMLERSKQLGDEASIATALNSLGTLAVTRGDNERARTLLEENLRVLRRLEAEGDIAITLERFHAFNLLGILAVNQDGNYARGAKLWEESLRLAREAEDADRIGATLCNLAYAALLRGDYERAKALCEEALALAHELGSAGVELMPETLVNLGLAERALFHHERAAASFGEAVALSQEMGVKASLINSLEGSAGLAATLGEDTRAARLWGAAEGSREATGIALPPGDRALHGPYLAAARSRLGEAAWEKALAEGRTLPLQEAAACALAEEENDPSATPAPKMPLGGGPTGELTRREREVATLVARGLTNRQIATELSISERTAANHVGSILSKLGLRSRAQIAAWATERQMLTPPHPE